MLTSATWLVRLSVVMLVAFFTFDPGSSGDADTGLLASAFVLAVLALGYWFLETRRGARRVSPFTASGLVVVALTSGFATLSPGGTALVSLVFIVVMEAAADGSAHVGWTVAGCGVLSLEVGAITWSAGTEEVIGFPLLIVTAFVLGRNRRAYLVQAEQSAALLRQVHRVREEREQVAVLEERARIAREIHDVLAHSLGALGIHIQAAQAVLNEGDVARAAAMLDHARRMTSEGLTETRRAVEALRGTTTARVEDEVRMLVETHRERYGADVELIVEGHSRRLPPEATVALTRVTQEGLVNVAKHAPGTRIDVRLSFGAGSTRLTIRNPLSKPGTIADTSPSPERPVGIDGGYGLTGMRERILLLGGSLVAGVQDGSWTVDAEVAE